jgi:hypothetical protein
MCKICERSTCICLEGRPTKNIVENYIDKLNIILDKHSTTLHEQDVKHILTLRSQLSDWLENKSSNNFTLTIVKSTQVIYKYIF